MGGGLNRVASRVANPFWEAAACSAASAKARSPGEGFTGGGNVFHSAGSGFEAHTLRRHATGSNRSPDVRMDHFPTMGTMGTPSPAVPTRSTPSPSIVRTA